MSTSHKFQEAFTRHNAMQNVNHVSPYEIETVIAGVPVHIQVDTRACFFIVNERT